MTADPLTLYVRGRVRRLPAVVALVRTATWLRPVIGMRLTVRAINCALRLIAIDYAISDGPWRPVRNAPRLTVTETWSAPDAAS